MTSAGAESLIQYNVNGVEEGRKPYSEELSETKEYQQKQWFMEGLKWHRWGCTSVES